MTLERKIRALAGTLVLIGLGVGYFVHPAGLLISAFVGLNLFQSSFTGFCPAEKILAKAEPGVSR